MEDIVAVRVELEKGETRYFITWGRLYDKVPPTVLEAVVLKHSQRCDLGGRAISAHLCWSLQEAARETYFFEALWRMGQTIIPYGEGYWEWAATMKRLVDEGKQIHYLGKPRPLQQGPADRDHNSLR